eukprot:Sspe_Gene.30087::Locus_14686_Transcript_2_2_Confidence_0.750_Length_1952::g.30087::m.30087
MNAKLVESAPLSPHVRRALLQFLNRLFAPYAPTAALLQLAQLKRLRHAAAPLLLTTLDRSPYWFFVCPALLRQLSLSHFSDRSRYAAAHPEMLRRVLLAHRIPRSPSSWLAIKAKDPSRGRCIVSWGRPHHTTRSVAKVLNALYRASPFAVHEARGTVDSVSRARAGLPSCPHSSPHVVTIDINGCFDSFSHEHIMTALLTVMHSVWVPNRVPRVKAGRVFWFPCSRAPHALTIDRIVSTVRDGLRWSAFRSPSGDLLSQTAGTPQGWCLSPILIRMLLGTTDILLHRRLRSLFPPCSFCALPRDGRHLRHVDDILVHVSAPSHLESSHSAALITSCLEAWGLKARTEHHLAVLPGEAPAVISWCEIALLIFPSGAVRTLPRSFVSPGITNSPPATCPPHDTLLWLPRSASNIPRQAFIRCVDATSPLAPKPFLWTATTLALTGFPDRRITKGLRAALSRREVDFYTPHVLGRLRPVLKAVRRYQRRASPTVNETAALMWGWYRLSCGTVAGHQRTAPPLPRRTARRVRFSSAAGPGCVGDTHTHTVHDG